MEILENFCVNCALNPMQPLKARCFTPKKFLANIMGNCVCDILADEWGGVYGGNHCGTGS